MHSFSTPLFRRPLENFLLSGSFSNCGPTMTNHRFCFACIDDWQCLPLGKTLHLQCVMNCPSCATVAQTVLLPLLSLFPIHTRIQKLDISAPSPPQPPCCTPHNKLSPLALCILVLRSSQVYPYYNLFSHTSTRSLKKLLGPLTQHSYPPPLVVLWNPLASYPMKRFLLSCSLLLTSIYFPLWQFVLIRVSWTLKWHITDNRRANLDLKHFYSKPL